MADCTTLKTTFDIITSVGVLIAAGALIINARTNFIAVMSKCTAEYRRIIRDMQTIKDDNDDDRKILKLDLLGLFNEQLFYIKKWYLPCSIRKEWKKSILIHLSNNDPTTNIYFIEEDFEYFPRVKEFMLKNNLLFNIETKNNLTYEELESVEFNIFNNLHLTEDGHTSILKRILHPNGTHGYGDRFLKLFLKSIKVDFTEKEDWKVEISQKSGKRGIVDLIIHNSNKSTVVVIENKIRNAPDQENQLYRYWRNEIFEPLMVSKKYDKDILISEKINLNEEIKKHYKLIYLTKDNEKKVSKKSIMKPNSRDGKYDDFPEELLFEITPLSYKVNIKHWLIDCRDFVKENTTIANKTSNSLISFFNQYIKWIE